MFNVTLHMSPHFGLIWIDDNSNLCVYMLMQPAKFPRVQLITNGWYLDCSRGFIPELEEPLYNSLVCCALEVIELDEEPEEDENPAPPIIVKEVASINGKGKGKRVASSQISTRVFTKTSIQRTAALAITVVGSPTATPFALPYTIFLLFLIAVSPSPPCRARRLSLRILPQRLQRNQFFSLWLRMSTWQAHRGSHAVEGSPFGLSPHSRIPF